MQKIESPEEYNVAIAEFDFLSARPADRDILARLSELEEAITEWEEKGKYQP